MLFGLLRTRLPVLVLMLMASAVLDRSAAAQQSPSRASLESLQRQIRELSRTQHGNDQTLDALFKAVDDVQWHLKMADIADVDKVAITSKPGRSSNPTGQGAGNPLIIQAYTFVPKKLAGAKAPLQVASTWPFASTMSPRRGCLRKMRCVLSPTMSL